MIHDKNNVLTDDELVVARGQLKKLKHTYLYMRNGHPGGFCVKQQWQRKKKSNNKRKISWTCHPRS